MGLQWRRYAAKTEQVSNSLLDFENHLPKDRGMKA